MTKQYRNLRKSSLTVCVIFLYLSIARSFSQFLCLFVLACRHHSEENRHSWFDWSARTIANVHWCRTPRQSNRNAVPGPGRIANRFSVCGTVEFHFDILLWSTEGPSFGRAKHTVWYPGADSYDQFTQRMYRTSAAVDVPACSVPKSSAYRPREDFRHH